MSVQSPPFSDAERLGSAPGRILGLTTRVLSPTLSRPWGPTVTQNHVIVVEVQTTEGTGTGFSWTPTIGARSVQSLLEHDIAAFVLDRTTDPVELWDELWPHLHEAGGGGMTTIAMAGVDLALWDLKARRAGHSVAALIGQRRDRSRTYGSGINLHYDLDALLAQTCRWVTAGHDGVKIKIGSPDPARDVERVAGVREILGPDRVLMVDANQRWDLETALRVVPLLQPYGLHWLEEPFRAEDTASHVALKERIDIRIAVGENLHTTYRFAEMIAAEACDVAQPNVIRVGGITPFLRIAALADVAGVEVAPHLLPDLSAQLACTTASPVWVEEVEDAAFDALGLLRSPSPVVREPGSVTVTERPGLGLDFVDHL